MFYFVVLLKIWEEGEKDDLLSGCFFRLRPRRLCLISVLQTAANVAVVSRELLIYLGTHKNIFELNSFLTKAVTQDTVVQGPLCLCLYVYRISVQTVAHKHLFS